MVALDEIGLRAGRLGFRRHRHAALARPAAGTWARTSTGALARSRPSERPATPDARVTSGHQDGSSSPRTQKEPEASRSWTVWGVTATVSVTDARLLPDAERLVQRQFAQAEAAAARWRTDAEIHALYRAGGRAITVSPVLADLVSASLITAERTGGDVDPTVSAALNAWSARAGQHQTALGARDLSTIPTCSTRTNGVRPASGWEQVHLQGRRLQVPAGTTLDLTATAKAVACDRAAARVADRLGVGVLVQLGGDAATAGPAPEGGWAVPIHTRDGELQDVVQLPPGAALATSHLTPRVQADVLAMRSGRTPGVHLIDPRTGMPPEPVWQQVSALGFSCLEATAYTAAALVRGTSARDWLTQLWVPARLVTVGGDVVTVGPWAAHEGAPDSFPSSAARPPDPSVPSPRPVRSDRQ